MSRSPLTAVSTLKHQPGAAGAELAEERVAIWCQNYVARLIRLADVNVDAADIGIEVLDLESR